jgi:hypothetical protein
LLGGNDGHGGAGAMVGGAMVGGAMVGGTMVGGAMVGGAMVGGAMVGGFDSPMAGGGRISGAIEEKEAGGRASESIEIQIRMNRSQILRLEAALGAANKRAAAAEQALREVDTGSAAFMLHAHAPLYISFAILQAKQTGGGGGMHVAARGDPAGHGAFRARPHRLAAAARVGLGRIVALYYRSSTLYQIH